MLLLFIALLGPTPAPRLRADYGFQVTGAGGATALTVHARFSGMAGRRFELTVPVSWAGEDSLRQSFGEIVVERPARVLADSGHVIVVDHPAGTAVAVHYRLRQDWTGPIRWPQYHRPIVDSSHILFNGQNGLITPRVDDNTPIAVRVGWRGIPLRWQLATTLGTARDAAQTLTARDLANASFVAGAFRVVSRATTPGTMTILTEGHWRFPDSAFAGLQQRVWALERGFWGDESFQRGLTVVLIPIGQRGTTGGTAFGGGFVEVADSMSDVRTVVRVAAHELLHMWNGQRMAMGPPEDPYRWFSEGFTDYYADRFLHAGGGSSDAEYAATVNRNLRDYYLSPFLGQNRDSVAVRYWSAPGMKFYPYQQGYILALHLDGVLRAASGDQFTVDSLMLRTYRASRQHGQTFNDSLLYAATPDAWRPLVREAIARFIDRGAPIDAPRGPIARCHVLRPTPIYRFDLGLDGDRSTHDKIVRGVIAQGPADRAGLRDGMTLRGWGWYNNDPTREASFTVVDSAGSHAVRYLPHGDASVSVPQLVRDSVGCSGH